MILSDVSGDSVEITDRSLIEHIWNKETPLYSVVINFPDNLRISSYEDQGRYLKKFMESKYWEECREFRMDLFQLFSGQSKSYSSDDSVIGLVEVEYPLKFSCKYRNGFQFGFVRIATPAQDPMAIKIMNDFDYQRGGFSPGAWPRARAMCLMIHKMREVAIREINGALIDDYSKTYMEQHTNKVAYFSNGISQGKVSGISSFFGNPSVRIDYMRADLRCFEYPIIYEVQQIKPKSLLQIGEKLAKFANKCPNKDQIDTAVSTTALWRDGNQFSYLLGG
jgi:hypothetical protein